MPRLFCYTLFHQLWIISWLSPVCQNIDCKGLCRGTYKTVFVEANSRLNCWWSCTQFLNKNDFIEATNGHMKWQQWVQLEAKQKLKIQIFTFFYLLLLIDAGLILLECQDWKETSSRCLIFYLCQLSLTKQLRNANRNQRLMKFTCQSQQLVSIYFFSALLLVLLVMRKSVPLCCFNSQVPYKYV